MAPSTRRSAQPTPIPQTIPSSDFELPSDEDVVAAEAAQRAARVELEEEEEEPGQDATGEDIEAEEEEDDEDGDPDHPPTPSGPPYAHLALREISTLASWTVSTSKPGCGVAALRSASTDTFWQSDGPQPHTLSLHFFKQVAIVALRVYLDFEADESYTPTRMQFLAGTGPHDLQEWAEMRFEQPKGWIDVDFEGVGEPDVEGGEWEEEEGGEGEDGVGEGAGAGAGAEQGERVEEDERVKAQRYWDRRPVLKAFLLQVRILENHQNGKDTHMRGLQVYARDRKEMAARRTSKAGAQVEVQARSGAAAEGKKKSRLLPGLKEPSWLSDPILR
ncbi:MAG: hypothetical protein Q9165_005547 [Trypethelium subeluteriae]